MATFRLFLFYNHRDEYRGNPIAAIAVVGTGCDQVDEQSAYDRFQELFGWDARHAICSSPQCGEQMVFAIAVHPDGYVPLPFAAARLIVFTDDDYCGHSVVAAVEVVDTGYDWADREAARARFAELYGWDPCSEEYYSPYTLRPHLTMQLIERHRFHPL